MCNFNLQERLSIGTSFLFVSFLYVGTKCYPLVCVFAPTWKTTYDDKVQPKSCSQHTTNAAGERLTWNETPASPATSTGATPEYSTYVSVQGFSRGIESARHRFIDRTPCQLVDICITHGTSSHEAPCMSAFDAQT